MSALGNNTEPNIPVGNSFCFTLPLFPDLLLGRVRIHDIIMYADIEDSKKENNG